MSVSIPPEPWRDHYAHPCAWDQTFPPLALTDLFAASAAAHLHSPLVDFLGRQFSYGALHAEARAFAAGLQAMGVGKGDRIGLYLPNVPIYVSAYFGALLAGATVVNFSPLYTAHELEAQVADSGARMLVTLDVPALLPTAIKVLNATPLERLIVGRLGDMLPFPKGLLVRAFGLGQRLGQTAPLPKVPDIMPWRDALSRQAPKAVIIDPLHDLALLQYTGGTTGTPKGAMLTHQNLSANARQLRAVDIHRDDRDVVLGALPLFHVFANSCILNRTVANGGCIVMLPRFDSAQVLATITRAQPTSMFAVPTMLQALLDSPKLEGTDFSSVRGCISGGAPLAAPLKARFEAATGVKVLEGYGLTESSGVVTSNPLHEGDRSGTIGQPLPGTRLRLLDKEDAAKDAPPGEPGELAVIGPQIMQGYWNRPDAAATAFVMRGDEPWLRTGDIAVIDADGFLRIVDRSKDMISVGGFKVFPSQVETVLLGHPAVKEALVIGMADDYRGEVPRAFVTLTDEVATGNELKDWLNNRVGKHERVDAVVIRDSLPKTMIGKLDRKALRDEVANT
jgi:long-chain acyl-CoA synthetase